VVDFEIPLLSSGKVFAASSYLGRGWLHELLSIISGTPLSRPPPAFEIDSHVLSSTSTALDFTVFLPYACDSFAKVLNDPLVASHEAFTNWSADMHAVCSLVSWISASAATEDAHLIRTASLEYTGSLIARIDTALGDSKDQAKTLSSSMLCLHWFAVELLIRACWSVAGSDKDFAIAISARLVGLASCLLQIGVQPAISHIVANHEPLDDFSLYSCVAELWICLVHLGIARGTPPTGAARETNLPSIADILQQSLSATESHTQGGLHASEEIWCTVFGLCAFSQFSVHGVSTSTTRMSTSWELVLLALDFIRLVADTQVDSGLSSRNLRRRDTYIRLLVSRCFILHQRWHWRLDDDASAVLFRRLVEIFKSRKFADLRGEIAGFSAFVQENDAHLLAAHASTDSAFTIFLKLIFASAEQIRPTLREDEYLGRTKKLLSLVTPVGSVQLSTLRSPFDGQLSMLYNRFSSLALAIRVLPSAENVQYRVSLARRYVDFDRSAAATRSVCIRAANFLALQALDMALPVSPALEWTSEIAQTLITGFRAVAVAVATAAPSASTDARRRKMELVQCTQLLLSGLLDMSRVTASAEKDPGIALEVLQKGMRLFQFFFGWFATCPLFQLLTRDSAGCFFPTLAEAELCAVPTIQALLQDIVEAHLNHALSLQRGEEPQEQEQQQEQQLQPQPGHRQEESQDEYGVFDLNWDDPMVLAALDNANAAGPTPVTAPVPAMTMQYTHQSIVEVCPSCCTSALFCNAKLTVELNKRQRIKSAASPTLFQHIIPGGAFGNQRQQH
jgi:Mus7/MMS22 family